MLHYRARGGGRGGSGPAGTSPLPATPLCPVCRSTAGEGRRSAAVFVPGRCPGEGHVSAGGTVPSRQAGRQQTGSAPDPPTPRPMQQVFPSPAGGSRCPGPQAGPASTCPGRPQRRRRRRGRHLHGARRPRPNGLSCRGIAVSIYNSCLFSCLVIMHLNASYLHLKYAFAQRFLPRIICLLFLNRFVNRI